MTLSDINSKISFLTSADTTSGGFANADRLISINNYKDRVVTAILQSMDGWDFDDYSITTTYPVATRNIVANQQDYKFSTSAWALIGPEGASSASNAPIRPLTIKRVEVSYDGGVTWVKAEPLDKNESSVNSTQTGINTIFQTTRPFYDLAYNALWLYPVPTVAGTACLKVWFNRSSTDYTLSDLTTGTAIPPFDQNFHQILAYGPAYEFGLANSKDNRAELKGELEQMMAEMKQHYGRKDADRNWRLGAEPVDYR